MAFLYHPFHGKERGSVAQMPEYLFHRSSTRRCLVFSFVWQRNTCRRGSVLTVSFRLSFPASILAGTMARLSSLARLSALGARVSLYRKGLKYRCLMLNWSAP